MKKALCLLLVLAVLCAPVAFATGNNQYNNHQQNNWNKNNDWNNKYDRHTCGGGNTPVCGDGKVNQRTEQCDGRAGVPRGYQCTDSCTLEKRDKKDSCVEALLDGKLVGTVGNDGTATVTNNGDKAYDISLVSYQMYAALIDDQTVFDYQTKEVKAGKTVTFDIDVPACGYQIDLVCGKPIKNKAPYYGPRVIDFSFENQDDYCTLEPDASSKKISAQLDVAPYFPKNTTEYVFTCTALNFTATHYDWYYGDGQILYNSTLSSVYHTYTLMEEFTVACRARNANSWAVDTLDISTVIDT